MTAPAFRIFETAEYIKRVDALTRSGHRSLEAKLKRQVYPSLKQSPYFGPQIRKLKNYEPETWRLRIGDYRIFYAIDEKHKVVRMISADHRKDAYR